MLFCKDVALSVLFYLHGQLFNITSSTDAFSVMLLTELYSSITGLTKGEVFFMDCNLCFANETR